MRKSSLIVLLVGALLPFASVQAHHAFAATFTNDVITVQGVVGDFRFINPHVMVYFNVTDESGEVTEWAAVGGSATTLRGNGWNRDTLESGDYITITGNSSRNGSPMISMEEINFMDPRTGALLGDPSEDNRVAEVAFSTSLPMTLPDGRPNVSGTWVGNPIGTARRPWGEESPSTSGLPGGFRNDETPQLTAAGAALQAQFDPKDDPQVHCEPPGLVRQAGFTPHPFSLSQYEDRVELAYEEYGGTRTVYFDDRDLVGGEVSRFGQSIASYEGDTLVIESTHMSSNLASPDGYALSDQTTTREIYSRLADENGVSMIAVHTIVEDPVYLAAPLNLYRYKYNAQNYDFIEVDCQKPL